VSISNVFTASPRRLSLLFNVYSQRMSRFIFPSVFPQPPALLLSVLSVSTVPLPSASSPCLSWVSDYCVHSFSSVPRFRFFFTVSRKRPQCPTRSS
jgi:hypothetical protein